MYSSTYHVRLQETSVVRVVAKLWTSVSMIKRLVKINLNKCKGMPPNLHNAILLKIMDLNALNAESRKKIQALVRPVGDAIFHWLKGHADFFHSFEEAVNFCPNLCWCPDGTIDNRATAEIMLEFDEINDMKRFILACIYCFEQHIVVFWKRLKMSGKITIDKETAFKYPLANYWLEFLNHKTTEQIDSVSLEREKSSPSPIIEEYQSAGDSDDYMWESAADNYIDKSEHCGHRRKNIPIMETTSTSSCYIVCPTLLDRRSKAKLQTIVQRSSMEREKLCEDDVINFLEFGVDKPYKGVKPRKVKQLRTKRDDGFLSYINCCPTRNVH